MRRRIITQMRWQCFVSIAHRCDRVKRRGGNVSSYYLIHQSLFGHKITVSRCWHVVMIAHRRDGTVHVVYNATSTISISMSVSVRKRQVAILARSSREMSLTVRIVWLYILARVRVSVRRRIFYTRKTSIRPNYRDRRPSRPRGYSLEWPSDASKCCQRRSWLSAVGPATTATWQTTHMAATGQHGHNDSVFIHGLKVWFWNYYVAHACVVFINITNEDYWLLMLSHFILVLHRFRCGA